MYRLAISVILGAALSLTLAAQPKKKKLLAIGAVAGYQHDSVSHSLATIEKIGRQSGVYDTYIRTDTQLLSKKKDIAPNAKNLDYFDAVYFYTTGELAMTDDQKADLLSFVRDDGKGFVGGHSSIDTFYKWPEYGEMTGAYFDDHPWGQFDAPILVEDRTSPITRHFPAAFTVKDEIYQPSQIFSREKLHVLMRLDPAKPVATKIWESKKPSEKDTDALHSLISTPFLEDGYIYGVCSYGQLRCLKAATGERVWETFAATTDGTPVRWATAFLVKNGDRFFLANEKGELIIAKLTPKGYDEISRARILEPTSNDPRRTVVWSHPAFANRCVYMRNDREIVCASLAK